MESKKEKIRSLVIEMLNKSHEAMIKNVEKALNSGAIDTEQWDERTNKMILPKCIVTAILQKESEQYDGKGTSFEKQVKREVKNIRYFI